MLCDPNNIHRIKNFLSKDDIDYFLNYFNENIFNQQSQRCMHTPLSDEYAFDKSRIYLDRVIQQTTYSFGYSFSDLSGTNFRKWFPGEFQDPHSDCESIFHIDEYDTARMTAINNFTSIFIECAALTYLNDDYEGGEIYFPDYDIIIKPEPGELIFFPGSEHYMHGVKKVTSGNRYVMQNFLSTPKLKYMWKYFVSHPGDIKYINLTAEHTANNKQIFTRNNIPESFLSFKSFNYPIGEIDDNS